MKINELYDQLSSKEQYRLTDRKDILAPKFPRSLFAFENRFTTVVNEIKKTTKRFNREATLLDIGCGDGIYEKLLPKEVSDSYYKIGLDFSNKQLIKAKKNFNETHLVDLDSGKLPIKAKTVDLTICSEVLEHLFFPEKVIDEIHRVLKPKGIVLITVPNFPSLQTRLSVFIKGYAPMINYTSNKEHIRFYSLKDIQEILGNKFIIYKIRGIGSFNFDYWNTVFKFPLPGFFQTIGDKFFPTLANGIMIVAQKRSS